MKPGSVSVIIPAYNCAAWIAEAVQSALDQSAPPLEVIVVDDGSTDVTPLVLAEFGDRVRYIRQPNRGVASARNAGIAAARGEFVAFLDADDSWHPRKLEFQLSALAERPEIGLLAAGVFAWPASAVPDLEGRRAEITDVAREDLALKNILATSSVVVRRAVLEQIGGFDESLNGPEDHDYWLRAIEVTGVASQQLPLTGYRTVAGSLSTRAAHMEAGMRRILRKLDERDFWRGDRWLRRRAHSVVAASCAQLHASSGNHGRAVLRLFESYAWHPLPLSRSALAAPRWRRMAVAMFRLIGVMRPEAGSAPAASRDEAACACPNCGANETKVLLRRQFRGRDWSLARCRRCGLHFTSPTPDEQALHEFYEGDYHAALRAPGAAEAAFSAKFERYADALSRHLSSGRIVDIGCSTGLLVRVLRDRGYNAEGLEPNGRSAEWGREHYRIPIQDGDPEGRYAPASLNAVVLADVLEHTQHPESYMRRVHRLLAPGGVALVTFPDILSVESRYQRLLAWALRREWLWSACHIPLHTWEFTRVTAERCFANAGFRVLEFRRAQLPPERTPSRLLDLLHAPLRLIGRAPFASRLGTQMEFVVQRAEPEAQLSQNSAPIARVQSRARAPQPPRPLSAAAALATEPSGGSPHSRHWPTLSCSLLGAACLSFQPLALNALSVPVMAFIIHRLGADGYGRWMAAAALLAVCATLTSLGLRGSFVRAVAAEPESAPAALAEQLGLRLGLSAIVGAAAMVACLALRYPAEVSWCTAVGITGLALTTCATCLADLLQAFHRIKTIAAVNGAAGLSLTLLSAVVAWCVPDPVSIAAAYLAGPVVSTALLLVAVRRHICPVSVGWQPSRFVGLLRESRFFAAQQLLSAGSSQAESLVLPRLVGMNRFGLFTAGTLLATRLTAIPDGLCTAAYPAMVKASAKRAAHGSTLVMTYLLIAGLAGVVIAAVGAIAAEPIGQILFPGRSAPFAAIARITIWSLPLMAVESVMGNALNAAGRDAQQARASVPAAVASLLVSVTLVFTAGITGACWSMLLRPAIRAAFLTPLMFKTFRSREVDSARPIAYPTVASPLRKAG